MFTLPKVSVITVCLNAKEYLEITLQSVLAQTYKNIEYIVIDGQSTDGTQEIIGKYSQYLAYWSSESDKGIANAFNKGFLKSTGDWIAYLNAGDRYFDHQSITKLISFTSHYDIIYGNFKGMRRKKNTPFCYRAEQVRQDSYWFKNAIPHQSCIVSRKVFDRIGLFDVNLKYAMDYDHFLRAYKKSFRFKAVDEIITLIKGDGVSAQFWWQQLREFRFSQKKNHLILPLGFLYHWERFLRNFAYSKLSRF